MRLVASFVSMLLLGCQVPLRIEPSVLPEGRMGEPYRAEIIVERANTPIAGIELIGGDLPPGLELMFERHQESAPTIEGIPTTSGTYEFNVHIVCFGTNFPGQRGDRSMTLVVHDHDGAPPRNTAQP